EDGIRDDLVTGVQTCALPILVLEAEAALASPIGQCLDTAMEQITAAVEHDLLDTRLDGALGNELADLTGCSLVGPLLAGTAEAQIGRASCREREQTPPVDERV